MAGYFRSCALRIVMKCCKLRRTYCDWAAVRVRTVFFPLFQQMDAYPHQRCQVRHTLMSQKLNSMRPSIFMIPISMWLMSRVRLLNVDVVEVSPKLPGGNFWWRVRSDNRETVEWLRGYYFMIFITQFSLLQQHPFLATDCETRTATAIVSRSFTNATFRPVRTQQLYDPFF